MTNKDKFIEVFGEELQRQYATKSWWEQEYVPPTPDVKNDRDILVIKAKTVMKRSQMKDLYRNLLEQKQYGIILLDDSVDVMVVKGRSIQFE